MHDISIVNGISTGDYQRLRKQSGWAELPYEQAENGLAHSYCTLSAVHEGKVIGMARLLWDGGYCAYLTDVIVDGSYHGQGIGSALVSRLMSQLKSDIREGWQVKVVLLAAKGREGFYERFGFVSRPSDKYGCGMDQWVYCGD